MTTQVQTIRMYGHMGKTFGRVHHMAVASAAEAVRALSAQMRGFDAYLTKSKDRGVAYAVFYGDKNLIKEELHNPSGGEDIRFAPIIMGSKRAGVLNIILGIVIIIVTLILDITTWGGFSSATLGYGYMMGWGMIIGGIAQLLTPVPKGRSAQDRPENMPGYAFNGPINTQAQGNPVPVLYGELIIGSAVLSAGISAVDQVYIPTTMPPNGSGGGGGGGSAPWHLETRSINYVRPM